MKDKNEKQPWGRVIALLTACVVTLIGAFYGIDPEIILVRALVAGSVLGTLTTIIVHVLNALTKTT